MACGAMAAQSAVNRWVIGSSPITPATIERERDENRVYPY